MTIQLIDIEATGGLTYRLTFQDGEHRVSFVFTRVAGMNAVKVDPKFLEFCRERASARKATDALSRFMKGEVVPLPIDLPWDGFMGAGG